MLSAGLPTSLGTALPPPLLPGRCWSLDTRRGFLEAEWRLVGIGGKEEEPEVPHPCLKGEVINSRVQCRAGHKTE